VTTDATTPDTDVSFPESTHAVPTLVVLGAGGDLTSRLLLPGLAGLVSLRQAQVRLVGSGNSEIDDQAWRDTVRRAFGALTGPELNGVVDGTRYVQADATNPTDLERLLSTLEQGPVILYFALPPKVTERACRALTQVRLPSDTRLVLEKPFGTDAASAEELNELVTELVPEDRIFRVDHYLGMSTVLNLFGVRFANLMLESVLDSSHVASVEVNLDESLALEGRAGYYDRTGALTDMLQSHALHVLGFLAMESPSTLNAQDVRDATAAVLRATRIWDDDPSAASRRARYTAGTTGDREVPAYVDEEGVDPTRGTETWAEMVVEVDTWRWAGVPFRLRSGKALRQLNKHVVITFRDPNRIPGGLQGYEHPDRMKIGLDPARLRLEINVNGPADPSTLERVAMESELAPGHLPPYGQVLAGVLTGDPTLSVRGDQAVQTWRIVEPVLRAFRENAVPLEEYPAGSDGPLAGPTP